MISYDTGKIDYTSTMTFSPGNQLFQNADSGVSCLASVYFPATNSNNGHPFYIRGESNTHVLWSNSNTYEEMGLGGRRIFSNPLPASQWLTYGVRGGTSTNVTNVSVDQVVKFSDTFSDNRYRGSGLNHFELMNNWAEGPLMERYRCREIILFDRYVTDVEWIGLHDAISD